MCVNVKSVNNASIGDELLQDNYVNTATSNVQKLKRVPKDSRVPLAESLSDKMNNKLYNTENVIFWLVFLTNFLFFFPNNPREVVVSK